jgi:RNA polymerase sigma factor (sigma-70 family)
MEQAERQVVEPGREAAKPVARSCAMTCGPGERLVEALERVRPKLLATCRSFRIGEDEEDFLQSAALLALEKIESIRSLEAWLVKVVWGMCMARARKRKAIVLEALPSSEAWHPKLEPPQEAQAEIWLQLKRVSARHRALLWLSFGEGHSRKEAADRLGCSWQSVGRLRSRALRRLRATMDQELAGKSFVTERPRRAH